MGEVFAAFDETLKRRVAIKAVQLHRLISAETKARFLREAQIRPASTIPISAVFMTTSPSVAATGWCSS